MQPTASRPLRAVGERPFEVRPLGALGAEIVGVDLAEPMSDELFAHIYQTFLDHQLLLFGEQALPPDAQVAFARFFGEVQIHVMNQYHASGHPELYYLSNLDEHGQPNGRHPDRGTLHWHTDGSWRERTGHATIMYSVEVPSEGGETHFCDMYGAYEALDDAIRQRLQGLKAVHNLDFSRTRRHGEDPMSEEQRRAVPPVAHPIVRRHPETGRRAVFLGDHAESVIGMSYVEGRALIEHLNASIIRPELVYRHHYRPGELVVWDNRCVLHRATSYDAARERRVMRRCTILGDRPFA
ncbi:MAG: TauD/TfdA family dioxygenase [Gammaproteobacteria bacterium]|nr:TauD/TfdA family dioxygenase [Gammaproteobacteria bacterium]